MHEYLKPIHKIIFHSITFQIDMQSKEYLFYRPVSNKRKCSLKDLKQNNKLMAVCSINKVKSNSLHYMVALHNLFDLTNKLMGLGACLHCDNIVE